MKKNKTAFGEPGLVIITASGLTVDLQVADGRVSHITLGLAGKAKPGIEFVGEGYEEYGGQILKYLKSGKGTFRLPLESEKLTPFQKKVFRELVKVPAGRTMTYGELASRVGGKKYARAVAMALAANPFPLVIPCHRVVAKDGLGGFSCGIRIKQMLLELEGCMSIPGA